MVRKKRDRSKGEINGNGADHRAGEPADRALVRDASEVRSLIERAQRLLRGESADAIDAALSKPIAAQAVDDAEDSLDDGRSLPDPNVLVSPKPRRSADPSDDDEDESDDDAVALDALPAAFFTTTMGTMLLSQGRALDARAVFERVLAKNPNDQEAARGLAKATAALGALSRSLPSSGSLTRLAQPHTLAIDEGEAKEPDGLLERADPPRGYDVDELRVLPVDPTTLVVFWEVRASTLRRLADEQAIRGELMLRIVTLVRAEDGALQRVERFEGPVPRVGDWFVWAVRNGASHELSVGVMGRVGFTAIMTAQPVRTPRGGPARSRSVVRARIVLPERTTVVASSVARIAEVVGPSSVIEALREARSTVALEGARAVHEGPAWLEEIAAPSVDAAAASTTVVDHWSETAPEGAGVEPLAASDERDLDETASWVEWAPGSSWVLIARAGAKGLSSPSSPWSASR
jgi:hypothetical protein